MVKLILEICLFLLFLLLLKRSHDIKADLQVIVQSADTIHLLVSQDQLSEKDKQICRYESNFIMQYSAVFGHSEPAAYRKKLLAQREKRLKDLQED